MIKILEVTYSVWKTLQSDNGWARYHRYVGGAGTEANHEVVEVYTGTRMIVFQASASGADATDWDTNLKSGSTEVFQKEDGHALVLGTGPALTDAGEQKTVVEPRPGSEKYHYGQNLCDATSWHEGSTQFTEVNCTDSGDLTTWSIDGTTNIIDLTHGRVFGEHKLTPLPLVVEVNTGGGWVEQTEGTDYEVDYVAGEITFTSALAGGSTVRASGWKAGSSTFTIAPTAGKMLKLEYVEVQYTTDIRLENDVTFEIYGYVQIFAPQLWDGYDPPGPYPTNTKIPLVKEVYKTLFHFLQESTKPANVLPPHGGMWKTKVVTGNANLETEMNAAHIEVVSARHTGSDYEYVLRYMEGTRAIPAPTVTLPFAYLAFRGVRDSYGMEIRVNIDGDQPVHGTHATTTFYGTSEDE